jgi:hypothetical protein
MTRSISHKAITDIQKISKECYGWAMSRDQAIDVWCIIAYNKPQDVITKAARRIHQASFREIIRGCAYLGVV